MRNPTVVNLSGVSGVGVEKSEEGGGLVVDFWGWVTVTSWQLPLVVVSRVGQVLGLGCAKMQERGMR
jgi:hypothetical protein